MKTIYIDSDFLCHTENAYGRKAIETNIFDGKGKTFIESYRFVPIGETWVRSDGVEFHGEMVSPTKDFERIMTEVAIEYLDDDQAETVTVLFDEWKVGVDYAVGDRRQYNGLLYKCLQAHKSQADWTPDIAVSLWVRTYVEEWIPWYQPTGAHDAWMRGMKMAYTDGHHYICLVDGTVYPPDVVPTSWEFVE